MFKQSLPSMKLNEQSKKGVKIYKFGIKTKSGTGFFNSRQFEERNKSFVLKNTFQ